MAQAMRLGEEDLGKVILLLYVLDTTLDVSTDDVLWAMTYLVW